MAFGISASTLFSVGAPILGGLLGRKGSSSSTPSTANTNQTTNQSNNNTQTTTLDPRIQEMLFGNGQKTLKPGSVMLPPDKYGNSQYSPDDYENNNGLLGQYQSYMNKPQNAGMQAAGQNASNYLSSPDAAWDNLAYRGASQNLLKQNAAPQMQSAQSGMPAQTGGQASINTSMSQMPEAYKAALTGAPAQSAATSISPTGSANLSQNNIDLKGNFNEFLNGESGANPFLMGAIGKGINQSTNAFNNYTDDAKQATQDMLNGIRGNAVSSGGFGGSRQGIAEGRAISDMTKNIGRAASQFGQNNTDAAVAAQSSQYGQDQSNKLNALMGLSGQQFSKNANDASIASQQSIANAQMQQQNNQFNASSNNQNSMFNVGNMNDASRLGFTGNLQNNQFNAGNLNNANSQMFAGKLNTDLSNTAAQNQFALNNTNNQQSANQWNAGAQLSNNAQNANNSINGAGLLGNYFSQNYALAQNDQNYGINNAAKVGSLIQQFMNAGATTTSRGTSTGNSTGANTTPMYQNNAANFLGGAALGKQIYDGFTSGGKSGGSGGGLFDSFFPQWGGG